MRQSTVTGTLLNGKKRTYMYMYVAMVLLNEINKRAHGGERGQVIESNMGQANTQTQTRRPHIRYRHEEIRLIKWDRSFIHEFKFRESLFHGMMSSKVDN